MARQHVWSSQERKGGGANKYGENDEETSFSSSSFCRFELPRDGSLHSCRRLHPMVSGASYFDFQNQTFEFAADIALPTNATGVFAPFAGSMNLVPTYDDGIGIDIQLSQIGSNPPFEQVSLKGLITRGAILSTPLTIWNDQPNLFIANGACTITLTGFEPTSGLCGISTAPVVDRAPEGWWTGYGFVSDGSPAHVPAPIAGAGLPGLISILLSWWRRRILMR